MRHALALDLRDDPLLIEQYELHHKQVWPDVLSHLRSHGVLDMEIYRLGTRLFMWMETDDATYDPARFAAAARESPRVCEWEALMWRFQAPTRWTLPGEKWAPMTRLFSLRDCSDTSTGSGRVQTP
ncbi:MAG TPA: L-rhamnose mutarotase [Steroidobacteraceae bacterium]|nr:L-rhamnose mutarotase [Steroidobacteraceae bacterium]